MRCKDAMKTGVEAFRVDDPVHVIAMRMRDVGMEFVPICDDAGRPVGVVTDFDIVRTVCADDLQPSKVPAKDVMEIHPITCFDSDDVDRAEELMNETHKPRILVCAERSGKLLGVMTLADMLRAEGEDARAAEVARQVVEHEYQEQA